MSWEDKFLDNFDNSVVDIHSTPRNGVISEVGSSLIITTPGSSVNCMWLCTPPNIHAPVAWERIVDYVDPGEDIFYIETRLTSFVANPNTTVCGPCLVMWLDDTHYYAIGINYQSVPSDHFRLFVEYEIDDGSTHIVNVANPVLDPNVTPHKFRMVYAPRTNAIYAYHSQDDGVTWESWWRFVVDTTFRPSRFGVMVTDDGGGVGAVGISANFDYLSLVKNVRTGKEWLQVSNDDFDNGIVDLNSLPRNGVITESGSELVVTCPPATDCSWSAGVANAPVAWVAMPTLTKKDFYVETKITEFTPLGESNAGILLWLDDDNFFSCFVYYLAGSYLAKHQSYVDGIMSVNTNQIPIPSIADPNIVSWILRIQYNPSFGRIRTFFSVDNGESFSHLWDIPTHEPDPLLHNWFIPIRLGLCAISLDGLVAKFDCLTIYTRDEFKRPFDQIELDPGVGGERFTENSGAGVVWFDKDGYSMLAGGSVSGDTETYKLVSNIWIPLSPDHAPTDSIYSRAPYFLCYDIGRQVIWGATWMGGSLIMCYWDGVDWNFITPLATPPMWTNTASGIMWYDGHMDKIYYMSLQTTSGPPTVWEWTGLTFLDTGIVIPNNKYGGYPWFLYAQICYDETLERTILFGGDNDTLGDDWTMLFDGIAWVRVKQQNPPPPGRNAGKLVYHKGLKKCILVNGRCNTGYDVNYSSGLWVFSNPEWDLLNEEEQMGITITPTWSDRAIMRIFCPICYDNNVGGIILKSGSTIP